jgi:hypothetical protein
VVTGLGLRYSSGAVEGHNNKIKMIKRQISGRANSTCSANGSSSQREAVRHRGRGDPPWLQH